MLAMQHSATASRPGQPHDTAEHQRLESHRQQQENWKRWGPYLSDRSWGTVREDYSADGSAWTYLPHDHARSKAYRWGEDGIAGISDDQQILCFSLAMWNGLDPIIKERFFGLTGPEGNHGEDVKELYYYLDSTPTHSYMRCLYKYPQNAYPYDHIVAINAGRTSFDPEYELIDTGIFDDSRYFDVFVEYVKATAEDIHIRITVHNRGPAAATIWLVPQLWYRNTWRWVGWPETEPVIEDTQRTGNVHEFACTHEAMGKRYYYVENSDGTAQPMFTNNETNSLRLHGKPGKTAYVKDAFDRYVVQGEKDAINPDRRGTKAGTLHRIEVPAGGSAVVRCALLSELKPDPFAQTQQRFDERIREADAFFATVQQHQLTDEERRVQRQALAGMLWSKQFYALDMRAWLNGDFADNPPPASRLSGRNHNWQDLNIGDILSMPDKWEYPWFAAWDLAFHVIVLAMIDIDFAKEQLELLISEKVMHANGQIPAYEWEFSDVNPPVQAWAVWRVYNIEKHANHEKGDRQFLERCYHKLLLNFTWWVNRKDSTGRNIFQGGFLGLDNISVFDRSQPLPGGGSLEQADATGWMGLFCLNLMAIGLELAQEDSVYEHLGIKFFEHFMAIAAAMNNELAPGVTLWNETDGWYYDVVHSPDGGSEPTRQIAVRSLVGLIPLFAAQVLEHSWFEKLPNFKARYEWLLTHRPELAAGMSCIWTQDGVKCLLSIVRQGRLERILLRALDEQEFLSPHGLRSLSRYHLEHPYVLTVGDREWTARYEPAESTTRLFGGNSNWRGPVWFPTAFMFITSLRVYDRFHGQGLRVECPVGSGQWMTLNDVAMELARRMCSVFLPDANGNRPVNGSNALLQKDPHFQPYVMFHEYFHGDTGLGLGANHQTGWTSLVAKMFEQLGAHRADLERQAPNP